MNWRYEQDKRHQYIDRCINETKKKMIEDDTIQCYGDTIMTDCNNKVSPSSIALRELIIYSKLPTTIKDAIHNILVEYGMMLEGELERLFDIDMLESIQKLLNNDIAQHIKSIKYDNKLFNEIEIVERVIEDVLYQYYTSYSIPTEHYNDIAYEYEHNNICKQLAHHYKCLKDPSLDWDMQDVSKYNIQVTYKELKTLALSSRDSGGNMDCFGYAHLDTIENTVRYFVSEKLDIPLNQYGYDFQDPNKELETIVNELSDEVACEVGKYYTSTY